MSSVRSPVDRAAVKLTEFVIKHKYFVVIALVALSMLVASGAKLLSFSPNYRIFFSGDNPELNTFTKFQQTYTKNDNFFFVLKPKDGDAFSPEVIQAVRDLTENAWLIPFVNRVDSVTNFQNSYAEGDDLVVEDLIDSQLQLSPETLAIKRQSALQEPLLNGQLVTESGNATAINVVLQLPGKTVYEVPTAAAKARQYKAQIEEKYPNIDVSLTGFGMLNNAFGESGYMDSIKLVPLMYVVLVISALIVLRSIVGTLLTLAVAYFAMGIGMGAAGYSGIYLTPVSNSAPIIIITLAIADCIHIFLTVKKQMLLGVDRNKAIIESMRQNFMPVSVTSLTTILGFLSLNFSDSPPFWHLGNIAAVGVGAAWLMSVALLPALLSILPYRVKPSSSETYSDRFGAWLGGIVERKAKLIFASGVLATLVLVSFVPTIEFNDQWSDYFAESIEFRRDTDEATKYFGLYPIEYSVPARGAQGVSDVEYLRNLDSLTEFLRTQPEVTHVFSITDILKRLNKNMHGDNPADYRLPGTSSSASEYLLVYELSLPYGLDLNDRINIDKSASRVTVMLGKMTTLQTKDFLNRTDAWIQSNLPDYMKSAKPTSAHVMFTYITDRNVNSMILGTIVAILVIGLALALALRSAAMGILSLWSNGLPILAAFGAWALLVGSVGFSVASVAAISLGIVVDDTVHFLSKYNLARTEKGLTASASVVSAFKAVAPALISSTVILVCGFIVMASSTFKLNADLGLLTALTIVFALLYDLLLLPAALILFDRRAVPSEDGEEMKESTSQAVPASVSYLIGTVMLLGMVSYGSDTYAEESAFEKGYRLSAISDRSDRGFKSSKSLITMTLENAYGDRSIREMDMRTLEVQNEEEGDKSIVIFRKPADISGTALLSHAKILDADDQWLWLHSLNRVKRISSKNKSGPFMGSEFAFEDFTALELNKYKHEWVKEEPCVDKQCNVIKRVPQYDHSGYSYLMAWIDTDIDQVRKVEFYDRKESPLKTLTLDDYKNIDGYWRSMHWVMVNHQTKKSTVLDFKDFTFDVGLDENDFVKERLKRIN